MMNTNVGLIFPAFERVGEVRRLDISQVLPLVVHHLPLAA
jgi:hypothetical protein